MSQYKSSYSLENLHLHLTRNCNLSCANCWIASKPEIESFSLSLSKIISIINEAATLGLKSVKLTGGEPFIYKDFDKLLDFLTKKDIAINIETNATIPFENYLKVLLLLKDRLEFSISIDGYDQKSNSLQRGGSFDIIEDNILLLINNNIKTRITTLITQNNKKDINSIIEVGKNLNVDSHRLILNLNPSGRATKHLCSSISFKETLDVIDEVKKHECYDESRKKTPNIYTTLPAAFQTTNSKYFNTCFWGINLCTVLSNLNVAICGSGYTKSSLIAGNLEEMSLTEIWNNSSVFKNIRNQRANNLKGVCANCIFVEDCRGLCRAQSVAVYDDVYAPYPFCQDAYNEGVFPEEYLIDSSLKSKY